MAKRTLPTDSIAVVGVIDPDANGTGDLSSGWIDMAQFQAFMAVIMAGTLGASATIDAKIEQAQDAAGTGAKDVTGAAITQLTQAGGDSDKQAVINCAADDLDLVNGFTHARLTMSTGGATSDSSAILLGLDPRYVPASDYDAASVAEIVTV